MKASAAILLLLSLAGGAAARSLQAAATTQCYFKSDACVPSEAAIIALGVPEDEVE